jgi:hypothetical protein
MVGRLYRKATISGSSPHRAEGRELKRNASSQGFSRKERLKQIEVLLEPLAVLIKGMPSAEATISIGDVAEQEWNILREDLARPVTVLRKFDFERNEQWIRNFCE